MADESERPANGMKDKFREALERKNSRAQAGEAHEDGRSKAKNKSTGAVNKRTFRRKTG